jgi:hypothetical protein
VPKSKGLSQKQTLGGATVAAFSVVKAVLRRPFSLSERERSDRRSEQRSTQSTLLGSADGPRTFANGFRGSWSGSQESAFSSTPEAFKPLCSMLNFQPVAMAGLGSISLRQYERFFCNAVQKNPGCMDTGIEMRTGA